MDADSRQVPNDEFSSRQLNFIQLDPRSLERYKALFVRPPGIPEQPGDNKTRLFLIVGEPESGKEIAAINFALAIINEENRVNNDNSQQDSFAALPIKIYQPYGRQQFLDLNEILTNPTGSGVFIIPDIRNLPEGALSPDNVEFYTSQLHKHRHKAFFILTTDDKLWINRDKIGLTSYNTDQLDLESVIITHENYYLAADRIQDQPLVHLLRDPETRKLLYDKLATPKKIGILFQNLSNASPRDGEEADAIQRLIRNILISETPELRRWFRELPMNVKLFAMTMAILLDNNYELTRFAAEELFFAFVQKVRQKSGMDAEYVFIDPRRVGFDDVVSSANMFIQGETLTFNSDKVLRNILNYEIRNYQGLLWILAEMLVDHIAPPPPQTVRNPAVYDYIGNPDAPTLLFSNAQEVLANLVGTIGVMRPERLRDLLTRLSLMSSRKELAGQILGPLSKKAEYHDFFLEILESWLHPEGRGGKRTEAYHPDIITTAIYTLATTYANAAALSKATHEKLHKLISHIAEICGLFDTFVDDYENARAQQLDQQIAEIRAEKGEKALTEGDIKARQDDLRVEVAQFSLINTELVTVFLLFMLREIAETFPDDVVKIINEWLQNGLTQVKDDDFELDDDADIERMLRIEDASSLNDEQTRTARKRQMRKRRIVLRNMQWHIGMLSAMMFFEADVVSQQDEQDAETDELDPDITDEEPHSSRIPIDEQSKSHENVVDIEEYPVGTDEVTLEQENALVDSNDHNPTLENSDHTEEDLGETTNHKVAISQGTETVAKNELQPDAEESSTEETTAKQPPKQSAGLKPRMGSDNRLSIIRKKFPLLDLLPNLLASADITFSPTSFLENVTRGQDVRQFFRLKKLDYQFDIPFEFLQRDALRAAFRMIHKWYGVMVGNPKSPDEKGQKEWVEKVFPMLLRLFNNATQGQRPRLREILFTEGWMESPHPEIRNMAHALLARSFILDGRILDLPSNRYGIVLLDWGIRDYSWDRYYRSAYRLIQQLSAITPLQIYALGSEKLIKEIAGRRSDVQILVRDLRPRRSSPRLLLPLLEKVFRDAKNTHFILALTPLEHVFSDPENPSVKPDILDLLDVVELVTEGAQNVDPKIQKILSSNLYREEEKEAARRELAATSQWNKDWEWKQKLFLLTPDKENIVQHLNSFVMKDRLLSSENVNAAESIFSIVDVQDSSFHDDVDTIVTALTLKLGENLHKLSNEQWEQDLREIWRDDEVVFGIDQTFNFDNPVAITNHIDQWISTLEDVTKARHPRDVTMTIVWTVLGFSRRDLAKTVTMVKSWLESEKMQANIIGLACAKTLYNFYYLSDDLYKNRQHYKVLFDLLPAITGLERGQDSSEYSQFLHIIMMVARDEEWSRILIAGDEKPLAQAVKKIRDRRGLADLRRLVGLHQIFVLMARLYIGSEMSWSAFRTFMRQVADWYTKTPSHRRLQQLPSLEEKFQISTTPKHLVQQAFALLDEIGSSVGTIYTTPSGIGVFTAFATGQVRELINSDETQLDEMVIRVRDVGNFIMLHTLHTLGVRDKMPSPQDGQEYGVILIRGSNQQRTRDLRSHVIGFVKDLRSRLREKQCNKIILTIHHLGRNELIYNNNSTPPTQITLRLSEKALEPAPLITPILESYREEDVAFILVVSDIQPLDLADWLDAEEWLEKIYLFGRGRSSWIDFFYGASDDQRKQRIKADIKEVTDMVVELIGC